MQISFIKFILCTLLGSLRVGDRCSFIPEDSRVDSACERSVQAISSNIGQSTDPVISDGLIGVQNSGVTLT